MSEGLAVKDFLKERRRMVEEQLRARGIGDERVLEAMLAVPRHMFVEEALRSQAYNDFPLPIGEGQTISQPYSVALMTEALQLQGEETVLEIGTGSGYQSAVLSRLAKQVFTVERFPRLARKARMVFDACAYTNIMMRVGDGSVGWEEKAPFEAIMVTAGAPVIIESLKQQLVPGGRLVMPVGSCRQQMLKRVVREGMTLFHEENLGACHFVPLVGHYGWRETSARSC